MWNDYVEQDIQSKPSRWFSFAWMTSVAPVSCQFILQAPWLGCCISVSKGWNLRLTARIIGEASTVVTTLNSLFHSAEVKMRCQSQRDNVLTLCCPTAAAITSFFGQGKIDSLVKYSLWDIYLQGKPNKHIIKDFNLQVSGGCIPVSMLYWIYAIFL